jgi:hypothetical protein
MKNSLATVLIGITCLVQGEILNVFPPDFVPPEFPSSVQLRSMKIAISTVIVPLDEKEDLTENIQCYVEAACVMFNSFSAVSNFSNVDFIVFSRESKYWESSSNFITIAHACGITVQLRPPLISDSDITGEEFKRALRMKALAGIGLADFDFLWAWSLIKYDRVIVMDADTFFYKSIDNIIAKDSDVTYTNGPYSRVNGGVFVLKPSTSIFLKMRRAIVSTDIFSIETGWNNTGIPSRKHGLATLQGFMYYFVNRPDIHSTELPRSIYNHQFDRLSALDTECQDVVIFHYSGCQKPYKATLGMFALDPRYTKNANEACCSFAFHTYKIFARRLLFSKLNSIHSTVLKYSVTFN